MSSIQGRIVLITGAKGGLGAYVTRAFLKGGATVAGVSRSISDADFEHANFAAFPGELSTATATEEVVGRVVNRFGRIDALVHLVGAYSGGTGIDATSDEMFQRMFDLNLQSAFFMMRAVLPHMRAQRVGRILAIGSRAGVAPQAMAGAYSISKAGLNALVQTVALENGAHNISTNIILPGTMDTPANRAAMPNADFSKWVQPCQVAELLVFLASDAASNVNGAAIPVYGSEA